MQAFINSVVETTKVDARKIDKCIDLLPKQFQNILLASSFSRGNKSQIPRYEETHYDDAYKVDDAVDEDEEFENRAAGQIKFWAAPDQDQDGPNMHQDASVEYGEEDQVMEDELVVKDENEIEEIAGADICPGSPRRGEGNTLKRKAKKSSEAWKRQQVTNIPFSSYECRRYVDIGESQARGTPHAMTCNWAKGFAEGWTIAANLSAAKTLAQAAEAKQGKDEPETDPECGIFVGWQHNQLDQESLEKPSTPVKSRDELRLHREARTSTTPPIQKQTTSQETVPEVRESPATRILDLVKQAEEKFEEQYGKGSWTRKPTDSDEDSAMEDEDDDLVV